jgi:uncharacterized membrane protein
MSVEERLDRLEQRLHVVETLVRDLVRTRGAAPVETPPPLGGASPPTAGPPASEPVSPLREAPLDPIAQSPERPRAAYRARALEGIARPRASVLRSEEWIGQRGLLAVGVLGLVLAAGYLLKLSFDRGWISPFVRCIGGAVGGAVVGGLGWRLLGRYRTYGASLIGCGAAIVYLAAWAAAKLYGLVPPATGIGALALVSLGLAAIAFAINVEALGTAAAFGAFIAPVLLGKRGNPDTLLIYLAAVGVALGWVAARKRWRTTAALVALSFFGLGWTGTADSRHPFGALAYTMLGGAGGIYVGLRERWWETRFLAFWGGWALLATVHDKLSPAWPTLVAGILLAAPVWWHALQRPTWLPIRLTAGVAGEGVTVGEALYFFTTPLLLSWAVPTAAPDVFTAHPGLVALVVGVPYLLVGYGSRRPPFALVGVTALATAVLQRWSGIEGPAILLGFAALWAGLDHLLQREDGRWYSLGTLAVALAQLLGDLAGRRGFDDAAFTGPWALVLWLALGITAALAAGLWRREPSGAVADLVPRVLWLAAGAIALFGVTEEIGRFFRLREGPVETAHLASGLAVSAWWLVFAAALVMLGLRRRIRPVRLAGLGVAGLAVFKVLAFDLASLDALYRVGSVFILGLVSLLLAYLYHRQARGAGTG